MEEEIKICDLELGDADKLILTLCISPTNIPMLCAKTNLAYSTVNQKVLVLKAKGLLTKTRSISGKTLIVTKRGLII